MSKELVNAFRTICEDYVEHINKYENKELPKDYFYNPIYEVEIIKTGIKTADIETALKALEIIQKKGLSLNELWYIKRNEPWSVYIEKMREIYFDDECVEDGKLKTQEEYELLRKALL